MRRLAGAWLAIAVACSGGGGPDAPPDPTPPAPPAPRAPEPEPANPLLAPSTLPFAAPAFDKIRAADFVPATRAALAAHTAAVRAITDDAAPPTFANTLVALERAEQPRERLANTFELLGSVAADPALEAAQAELAPLIAEHDDDIHLDAKLFARIETVYAARAQLHLPPEDLRLLEQTRDDFVRGGAQLPPAAQAELRALDREEATLQARFTADARAETDAAALVADSQDALLGLGWGDVTAAAAEGSARGLAGKWYVPTDGTTLGLLTSRLVDRAARARAYRASLARGHHGGPHDTQATIARLAQIRARRAELLGYPSAADLILARHMLTTPAAVWRMLDALGGAALARLRRDLPALAAVRDRYRETFDLQPYDFWFYANQVAGDEADRDGDEPDDGTYLDLEHALDDGVFYVAQQLYGVTFTRRTDLPTWHPDVRVYEVRDEDGTALGLVYADFFAHPGKRAGAWTFTVAAQSTAFGQRPIVASSWSFTKPAPGRRPLLDAAEARALFHEFGHALDGILAHVAYPSDAGMTTPMDFVEYPSQFMETWTYEPSVLAHYARDDDGQPMPARLAQSYGRVDRFSDYEILETVQAAAIDLAWHSLPASAPPPDPDALEAGVLRAHHLDLPIATADFHSTFFSHIWRDGYAAGYYGYLWTSALAWDTHAWFVSHGGLTRDNGKRFRDLVLARGDSVDPHRSYVDFRGAEPSVQPLLDHLGLGTRKR